MRKIAIWVLTLVLVTVLNVPSAFAVTDDGFIDAIAADSGYTFGENAEFEVRFVTENARSNEGVVEFVVSEELEDGTNVMTFLKPYSEDGNELHQMTIQEYNAKINSRAPVNEFNIIKGDVNVYLRAYYTSTTRNGWGGRFFRPVTAKMKCTYSTGTVTAASVGLGLRGELYNLDVSSTVPINDDYEYISMKSLGTMTSGVEKSATVTSLPSGQYVYVGSGSTTGGSVFVVLWEFTRNNVVYQDMGHEVVYSQASAG